MIALFALKTQVYAILHSMQIRENISLKDHTTMRLGGTARYAIAIRSKQDLLDAIAFADEKNLPIRPIGGGSNIIWRDEGFNGVLLTSENKGIEILAEDDVSATLRIAGGELLDEVIAFSTERGLSGIETLSLIPGTFGSTPIQNVEAYGQEIAQTLVELDAYDTQMQTFTTLKNEVCNFSYRSSRFKTYDNGRFLIYALVIRLSKAPLQPPFHQGLQSYVDQWGKTDFSPQALREYVIDIRSQKLPDWNIVANNGSFFNNALIGKAQFNDLFAQYPDIQHYPMPDGTIKVPARWLIENAGFNAGYKDEQTGCGLWPKQALVVVNYAAQSTNDLETFARKIIDAVQQKFNIILKQEPELLP